MLSANRGQFCLGRKILTMSLRVMYSNVTVSVKQNWRAGHLLHINPKTNKHWEHLDGLAQHCSNSSANALELLKYCTKPSIYGIWFTTYENQSLDDEWADYNETYPCVNPMTRRGRTFEPNPHKGMNFCPFLKINMSSLIYFVNCSVSLTPGKYKYPCRNENFIWSSAVITRSMWQNVAQATILHGTVVTWNLFPHYCLVREFTGHRSFLRC